MKMYDEKELRYEITFNLSRDDAIRKVAELTGVEMNNPCYTETGRIQYGDKKLKFEVVPYDNRRYMIIISSKEGVLFEEEKKHFKELEEQSNSSIVNLLMD